MVYYTILTFFKCSGIICSHVVQPVCGFLSGENFPLSVVSFLGAGCFGLQGTETLTLTSLEKGRGSLLACGTEVCQ